MPTPANLTLAVDMEAPTVRDWLNQDRTKALMEVAAELVLFADVINVKDNINPEKAKRMAELFLDMPETHGLKLPELRIFFRDAFNFRFGQLYGGFGWNDLAVWFRHFMEERILVKRTRSKPLEQEPEHEELTPQEQLQALHKVLDNLGEVPIVFPFSKLFELIRAKDPDHFRKWYLEEAHHIIARAKAFGVRESMMARTIGETMKAETYKTEAAIDQEVKTEYVRDYCKRYLNQKKQANQ